MQLGFRIRESGDGINGTVMDTFLHGLTVHAATKDHRITLFTARDDAEEVTKLRALHETGTIDGCVLSHTSGDDDRPRQLLDARIPFVAFGRPWGDEDAAHSWLDVDARAGTRAAAKHLRDAGHRRIGFIGWPDVVGTGFERRWGWLEGAGLDEASAAALEYADQDGLEEGARGARKLLDAGADAIICASDSLAMGALSEYRASRRHATIVGFDDTPVARALGLSSLRQPMAELAAAAVDQLLLLVDDPATKPLHSLHEPVLELRRTPDFL